METRTNQNQIVIKTNSENEKTMLPMHFLITMAAGAIVGMAIIFGLFWGVEMLTNL